VTKEKVITMNDEQFRKIKLNRTLYSAEIIDSSEPEYFLDYKITTVRYLPTDEHYDIVREMFAICDNDPDNVVNWYNEKLIKILEYDLKIMDSANISTDSTQYERIQKCRYLTLRFLMSKGRIIGKYKLAEKHPEEESKDPNTINLLELYEDLHLLQQLAIKYLGNLDKGRSARIKDVKKYIDENYQSKYNDERLVGFSRLFRGSKVSKHFYKHELIGRNGRYRLKRSLIEYTG
jgi:hypothetical protein